MSLKLKKIKNKIKHSLTRTKNSLIRTKNSLSKKIKVKRSTLQIVFLTLLTQYSFKIFSKWIKVNSGGEDYEGSTLFEKAFSLIWWFIKTILWPIFRIIKYNINPPPPPPKQILYDADGNEVEVTTQEDNDNKKPPSLWEIWKESQRKAWRDLRFFEEKHGWNDWVLEK